MPKTSISYTVFRPAVAVFDASILYPFHLRNVLVQAAVDCLVEARWSDAIHDEWIRNLVADAPAIPIERLQNTRRLMDLALPGAMVTGYLEHVQALSLPDADDRHVVAVGIVANASLIITWNLRDFLTQALDKQGLRATSPDEFLAELYADAPDLILASLARARHNLNRTRVTASDFVEILRRQRLTRLAARITDRIADL